MYRYAPSLYLSRWFGVSTLDDWPKKDPLLNAFGAKLVARIKEDVGNWLKEQLIRLGHVYINT
jgi:hypothetical protein